MIHIYQIMILMILCLYYLAPFPVDASSTPRTLIMDSTQPSSTPISSTNPDSTSPPQPTTGQMISNANLTSSTPTPFPTSFVQNYVTDAKK